MVTQGNEYGASLKIMRVANGWKVEGSYDYSTDRPGTEWAFQDAALLGRFLAKWCVGELTEKTDA